MTLIIRERRIHSPVKHLRWSFQQKYLTAFSCWLILQKASPKKFDTVLNTPLMMMMMMMIMVMTISVNSKFVEYAREYKSYSFSSGK